MKEFILGVSTLPSGSFGCEVRTGFQIKLDQVLLGLLAVWRVILLGGVRSRVDQVVRS